MANSDSPRIQMQVRVAWLYYEEQLTQAEIGDRLGISRVAVNRLLKEARENNIVEIKINSDLISTFPLARELTQRYGLREVYITQPCGEADQLYPALAHTAASVLEQYLVPDIVIGIGIGRSISHIPDSLHPVQPVACQFTSLIGGVNIKSVAVAHNFDILTRLASQTGGQCSYISAPSFVSSQLTRDIIVDDPSVHQNLEVARSAKVAVFSVGEITQTNLLYQLGLLSESDIKELQDNDACGDVLGRFFDKNACELDINFNHRVIGLSINELKQIPTTILVAGGTSKRIAIQTLLNNHVGNVLVTDPTTAEWLANSR